jgi:hypothetical protein
MNLAFGHHLSRQVGRARDLQQAREVVRESFAQGIS